MTIIEALKSEVQYSVRQSTYERILINRNLVGVNEYSASVGASNEYRGAVADLLTICYESPNIREDNISISKSESSALMSRANLLYRSIGEQEKNIQRVTFI